LNRYQIEHVSSTRTFEILVLPHLDAGFNLARWLLRDEPAAEDAVQEASLRAFRYLDSLRGDQARPWFLRIVRNTCYTYLEEKRGMRERSGLDEDELDHLQIESDHLAPDPSELLGQQQQRLRIDSAIRSLSPPLREVIVLREIEGLEYAEIAEVASIPLGTVMSRLSRARDRLRTMLSQTGTPDRRAAK
jgi:RNA polymerase sigma factor (sigma-70 family)